MSELWPEALAGDVVGGPLLWQHHCCSRNAGSVETKSEPTLLHVCPGALHAVLLLETEGMAGRQRTDFPSTVSEKH